MGTTCMPKPANVKEELRRIYGDTTPEEWSGRPRRRVLEIKIVGMTEAYLAVEDIDERGNREVWAGVCKLSYSRGYWGFCYKEMDETMGPYMYNCPESILNLLTPTNSEYAKQWREKCRETLAARKAAPPAFTVETPEGKVLKGCKGPKTATTAVRKLARELGQRLIVRHTSGQSWVVTESGYITKV